MKRFNKFMLLSFLFLFILVLSSCGGSSDTKSDGDNPTEDVVDNNDDKDNENDNIDMYFFEKGFEVAK